MIRRMRMSDAEQVAVIEKSIFSEPWSKASFEESMEKSWNIYLVAEENDVILGYCGLWGITGEGEICNVAVREDCRGQGIAGRLLDEMLRLGEEAGIHEFTLEVRVSNAPAIHLYHKLGFVDEGIRKNFYSKPTEDAIIMWRRQ